MDGNLRFIYDSWAQMHLLNECVHTVAKELHTDVVKVENEENEVDCTLHVVIRHPAASIPRWLDAFHDKVKKEYERRIK